MRKGLLCCVALLTAIGLAGCMPGVGVFNGLGDDPMPMIKLAKSDWDPRTGENPILYNQFMAAQDLVASLKIQIDWQTSSTAEACASSFLPYGIAGAAGGAATGALYPNAGMLAAPAAGVTGLVYGFGGCVNGAVTHSYSNVYAVGDMLEKAMRDHERDPKSKYRDANGVSLFRNLHAVASFTRSRNATNSPAPGLQNAMRMQPRPWQQPPAHRWSGPPVGPPPQDQPYPAPPR